MRRRLMDCSRQKRLPCKKSRITEPVQTSSSFLHWKLLLGWLVILLLDSMADFRFEYLYPILMFLRSVYDSYKYQGLIFSLLFICLVVYLDLLCWTVLTGPWLFLGASSCVWLEFMRSTDHSFSYSTLSLWMLFLYVEISHRLHNLPQHLVNVSRPFAAHCIGYPVVTMSFLIKHQITHIIRQRQQKRVAEENSFYFDVLQKALPPLEEQKAPEDAKDKAAATVDYNGQVLERPDQRGKISPKVSSSGSSGGKSGPKVSSSNSKHGKSSGGGRTDPRSSSVSSKLDSRVHDPRVSVSSKQLQSQHELSKTSDPRASPTVHRQHASEPRPNGISLVGTTVTSGVGPIPNGDIIIRPSSAGSKVPHVHVPSGKKQATVKAVPRSDLPPMPTPPPEAKEKAKVALEALQADLKSERAAKSECEATISRLQLEVKKLKADLQASCLQEEETATRVDQLAGQEKSHKVELQRLRNESDNLQNKLAKLSTGKQQDQASITVLERRLKHEADARARAEAELRNHRMSMQNSWSEEEVRELQEKLSVRERELERLRKELLLRDKAIKDVQQKLAGCHGALLAVEEERNQLKASLHDETKVKIELFTALSDARRKQQNLIEECRRKNMEIDGLRKNLAEIMAIMPSPPPSLPPPCTTAYSPCPTPHPQQP